MEESGKIVSISLEDNFPHLLVSSHVLFAAEALAASVAEVKAGHVAPLVDGEVVRLRERPGAPPTVVGLPHGADLEGQVVVMSSNVMRGLYLHLSTYLQRLFPVYNFCLVHIDTQTDSKHFLGFQICPFVLIW